MDELKRLVRELLDAWDAWMDTDEWSGPAYDELAEAVRRLREHLDRNP